MCGGSGKRVEPEVEGGNLGNDMDMEKKKLKTKTTFVRTPLKLR